MEVSAQYRRTIDLTPADVQWGVHMNEKFTRYDIACLLLVITLLVGIALITAGILLYLLGGVL
jgi:hypothetical protein